MNDEVATLRAFNRSYTQRIGVLAESYLDTGRPLGPSRLLFEIGADGARVGDLRRRLGLDSGYLSRLLRQLEHEELITVDGRSRRPPPTVRPTLGGRTPRVAAARPAFRTRRPAPRRPAVATPARVELAAALTTAERLLRAATVTFDIVDPRSPDAEAALGRYFDELDVRFHAGFDPAAAGADDGAAMGPPRGAFVLLRSDGTTVGCGGLQPLDDRTAEIKRMWIDRPGEGSGSARDSCPSWKQSPPISATDVSCSTPTRRSSRPSRCINGPATTRSLVTTTTPTPTTGSARTSERSRPRARCPRRERPSCTPAPDGGLSRFQTGSGGICLGFRDRSRPETNPAQMRPEVDVGQDEAMIRRLGKNLGVFKGTPPAASVQLELDGYRRCVACSRVRRSPVSSTRSSRPSTSGSRSGAGPIGTSSATRCSTTAHGHKPWWATRRSSRSSSRCSARTATSSPTPRGATRHRSVAARGIATRAPRPTSRGRAVGRPHPVPGVRHRRAHHAAGLSARERAHRRRARKSSLRTPCSRVSSRRSRAVLRRALAGAPHGRRRRRLPVRLRHVASGNARPPRAAGPPLPAGALRPARHRPAAPTDHRGQPADPEATARAVTPRQRSLVGLHDPYFYDG